jgi:hypothetical protein
MSRLYLRCAICSRQQADGLLSGAAWARLELPQGVVVEHAALRDSTLRACPSCASEHGWEERLLRSLGIGHDEGFSLRVDRA